MRLVYSFFFFLKGITQQNEKIKLFPIICVEVKNYYHVLCDVNVVVFFMHVDHIKEHNLFQHEIRFSFFSINANTKRFFP